MVDRSVRVILSAQATQFIQQMERSAASVNSVGAAAERSSNSVIAASQRQAQAVERAALATQHLMTATERQARAAGLAAQAASLSAAGWDREAASVTRAAAAQRAAAAAQTRASDAAARAAGLRAAADKAALDADRAVAAGASNAAAALARKAAAEQAAARAAAEAAAATGVATSRDVAASKAADAAAAALARKAAAEKAAAEAAAAHAAANKALGTALVGIGAVAAFGIYKATSAFADFDQQMSNVQAATHAGAVAMNQLRDAAIEAGARTQFSTVEAGQGIEELAKAGVSTSDILGGALNGALDLAAAGSLDVADAAETAASAMVQFGLKGKDVPHIADLLAAGAGKAQGSVQDMGLALSYVGPVAAQMGISIEETAGSIALMANNGILGERAGTGLRGILQSLINPSQQAKDEMRKLGLSFYDASGNFIGFNGAAEELRQKLAPLPKAERDAALGIMFTNAALPSAIALFKGGADAVDLWTGKVNDAGYAQETAAIKMDNLKGDIEKLGGSINTVLVQGGSAANASLRGLTQSLTTVVNLYAKLPQGVQGSVTVLGGLVAVVGLLGGGFLLLAPRIVATRTALQQLNITSGTAGRALKGLGAATGAVAVLGALGAATKALQDHLVDAVPGVQSLTGTLMRMQSATDLAGLGYDFKNLGESIQIVASPSTDDKIYKIGSSIATLGQSSPRYIRQATDAINSIDAALAGLVQGGHTEEAQREFNLINEAAVRQGRSTQEVRKALPQYAEALAGVANEQKLTKPTLEGSTDAMKEQKTAAELLSDALDALNGHAISAARAEISWQASVDAVTASVKQNGKSLNTNTEKGRENRSAILDAIEAAGKHAQAVADETGSVDKGTAAFRDHIAKLRDTARKAGLTDKQIDTLIKTYARVPTKISTNVSAPGATAAQKQISAIQNSIYGLDGKTVRIAINYGMSRSTSGGIPTHSADGNVFESHQAEIAPGGPLRVWAEPETGGEAYIPLSPAKRPRSEAILDDVAERFGYRLQRFADGGVVSRDIRVNVTSNGAQAAIDSFMSGVQALGSSWAQKYGSSYSGGGAAGSSSNEALGRALAAARGWGGSQADALDQLWTHESGWRNTAQNPTSTAYGIPQFLNSSWPIGKTSDPRSQIEQGLMYIASRYGTPADAWRFWQAHHWYATGGYFDSPQVIGVGERGAERLLDPRTTVAFEKLAKALGTGHFVPMPAPTFTGQFSPILGGSSVGGPSSVSRHVSLTVQAAPGLDSIASAVTRRLAYEDTMAGLG